LSGELVTLTPPKHKAFRIYQTTVRLVDYHPGSPKNIGPVGGFYFIIFYFPEEKLLIAILFLSTKGVSFNASKMFS
jgi:hypothetical protein